MTGMTRGLKEMRSKKDKGPRLMYGARDDRDQAERRRKIHWFRRR